MYISSVRSIHPSTSATIPITSSGSTIPKFRSVPEFIPHAIWLSGNLNDNCQCKYCSKKPQREITSNMGEKGIIASSPGPNSSPSRPLQSARRKPRASEGSALKNNVVYAAVQKIKNHPVISPLSLLPSNKSTTFKLHIIIQLCS